MVYCLLLVSVSALFSTNILVDNAKATWWNSSWDYYKSCSISNKIDDYQMKLVVGYSTGGDVDCGGHCQSDFDDIRFVNLANTTEYPYWMENYTASTQATFWMNNTDNADTILMYYGNSGVSTTSNGGNTFCFFDDFNSGSSPDTNKWDTIGTISVDAGYLKLNPSETEKCFGKSYYGEDYSLRWRADVRNDGGAIDQRGMGWMDTNRAWAYYQLMIPRTDVDSYKNGVSYQTSNAHTFTSGFKNYEVKRAATQAHLRFYEGTTQTTESTSSNYITTQSLMPYFYVYTADTDQLWIDWVFVRKYKSTEPSWSSFGTEQTQGSGATIPTVTTNDATGVEENNATIRGTLTNNGSADTTCYFIWGDETPPTDHNDSQGIVAHEASFSKDCTSLSEGTLYYFYTKASNSEGWDVEGAGGIKSFLTKPDPPTGASASSSDGESSSWINLSWTAGTGADRYYVRYSDTTTPTTRSEGTELCNVTTIYYNSTFSTSGTYYFSIWSYASEVSPALHQWSDAYNSASEYLSIHTWHSESFGGKLTATLAIDVELNDSSWIAGSLDCGDDVQKNFTFYQNGTATIDITIGINSTNGNYSFVNYTTWSSNGHDQYCANFTVDTWSSESMIEPDYPASSVLKSSFAPGNFVYGIRLWMPKSVTYQDKQEDFEVVLYVSEST